MSIKTVLILGGTSEGADLARALAETQPNLTVITALAGVTETPSEVPGTVHVGGFGGADGLAAFLKQHDIDALIDATHPFAANITQNAVKACEQLNLPRLRLDRPQWILPQKTDAVFVPDAIEAANLLVRTGSQSAFLTIGRKALDAFEGLEKTHLLVRLLDEPKEPLGLTHYSVVTGRPPFSVEDEEALMREHHIDTLVTKASGGETTRAKLDAAERLRVRIILIRRPLPPDGARITTVEGALDWIVARL